MEEEAMEELQQLRFKASELLLREEWDSSIRLYDHFISQCQKRLQHTHLTPDSGGSSKLEKSLCIAFSNRAEARLRLKDYSRALEDCDRALNLENTHLKALVCKGRALLDLQMYAQASECFKQAVDLQKRTGDSGELNKFLDRCKRLEFQSRTGGFDLSDWVLNGFRGENPELGEYVGPIQVALSENGGRGLFATKKIEAGSELIVTKAVGIGRAILSEAEEEYSNGVAHLVMWKDFVEKIMAALAKCRRTLHLIHTLSTGEDEGQLDIPEMSLFKPESAECFWGENTEPELDTERVLKILDVNSLTEDAFSAKVLGKNSAYYGVGLWILPSFINHSCNPNARRLHVGDHILVHASRDIKAGEEIFFAYFDVMRPLKTRREVAMAQWGFCCNCKRCKFEEGISSRKEMKGIEKMFESGSEMGEVVVELEEGMKKWAVKGKHEKGFLRASFWSAYENVLTSERLLKRFGWRGPSVDVVVEGIAEVVGGDDRLLSLVVEGMAKSSSCMEMERIMKLGRSVFGRVVKKQAMRSLCLSFGSSEFEQKFSIANSF